MKILKFTVDGKCEEKEISGTLESLQAEVGGYIESVKLFSDEDITALVDKEGRLKGKPRNKCLKSLVGDFIIVGVKSDEFCDVPAKKIENLKNIFRPEMTETSAVETVCKAHFVPGSKDSCKACPLYEICWHFQGPPEDCMEIMESKAEEWLKENEHGEQHT